MMQRHGEAVIRVSGERYIRRNPAGTFSTTDARDMATRFELTPVLLKCLREWRRMYGIPWLIESASAEALSPAARLERVRPECPRELPADVRTEDEWSVFVEWMLDFVCRGFHPDSHIADYINLDTGRASFDPEFAYLVLQPMLEQAFSLVGSDRVYEIACDRMMARCPEMGADYRKEK